MWELFAIGFGFGLAGPCLLACTPIMLTYLAGINASWKQSLIKIFIFLVGRLLAYFSLGYLAGLSGLILRQFCNSSLMLFIKALGGLIVILLGAYVLFPSFNLCNLNFNQRNQKNNFFQAPLFILGFIVGVFPCAPLMALLFEITLVSKGALNGAFYALFFGLGTLVSGFIVMGSLSGIFAWLPAKIIKSKKSNFIFRTICALLLIWLGLKLILYKTGS